MATATAPAPPPTLAGRDVVNDAPLSAEAYLERERAEPKERHEYLDGWVYRASGASCEHTLIVGNINAFLHRALRDTDCRAVSNDLRVALPDADTYAYPDLVVCCGAPELDETHGDMLYNPVLIVEVLSPSTADYDRGEKFARYRRLDTLREYVLVAQDRPHVARYAREDATSWRFTETDDPETTVSLDAVDAELPLADVYVDVFEGNDDATA
jgi:Uma2 family endonuclease